MWEWSKDVSPVNKFIFPAPHPSSYSKNSLGDELLFIPPKEKLYHFYKQSKKIEKREKERQQKRKHSRYKRKSNPSHRHSHSSSNTNNKRYKLFSCPNAIPCLYIERKYPQTPPTHLLLYFHGNAEDLGKTYPILDYVRVKLSVNVLCPEYPGYGIAYGSACESSVAQLVQNTYEFVISPYGLNIPPNRIIIYGFSIGSAASLSMSTFPLNRVPIPHPPSTNPTIKQFFYSTFYEQCPHTYKEHEWLFTDTIFPIEDNDTYTDTSVDPFFKLPLASLLNILRKANINYPTSVNKTHLLTLARNHDLIPPIISCQKANIIRKYALIIIVCPFSSITQVVADKVGSFASYLLSERFDNTLAVPNIHGPLLIIHGRDDSIIPCEHSQMLYKIAVKNHIRCSIEILDGCDHNTMDLRRITGIINNYFQHQFNLCRSQQRLFEEQECFDIQELYFKNNQKRIKSLISNGWGIQGYKKYITNDTHVQMKGNMVDVPFAVHIPTYCHLRPRFDHPNTKEMDMVDIERERLKDEQEQKYSHRSSTVSSLPLSPASVSVNNNNTSSVVANVVSDDDDEHPFIQLMKLFDIHVDDGNGRFDSKKYSNTKYKKHFSEHPKNVIIYENGVKHKYPTSPKYPEVNGKKHVRKKSLSEKQMNKVQHFFGSNHFSDEDGNIDRNGRDENIYSASEKYGADEHEVLVPSGD